MSRGVAEYTRGAWQLYQTDSRVQTVVAVVLKLLVVDTLLREWIVPRLNGGDSGI